MSHIERAAGRVAENALQYVCMVAHFSLGMLIHPRSMKSFARLTRSQGVFTNAALQLGKIMDSPAFAVVSTALLLILLVLWFAVQIFTVKGIIGGRILGLEHGWKRRGRNYRDSAEIKDA